MHNQEFTRINQISILMQSVLNEYLETVEELQNKIKDKQDLTSEEVESMLGCVAHTAVFKSNVDSLLPVLGYMEEVISSLAQQSEVLSGD